MIRVRHRRESARRSTPRLEALEGRALLTAAPSTGAAWLAWLEVKHPRAYEVFEARVHKAAAAVPDAKPLFNLLPLGNSGTATYPLEPSQIATGYNYPTTTAKPGAGETIAIVDAYSDPNIAGDLSTFDSEFNLPQFNNGSGSPSFTIVQPSGKPAANASWGVEISLDVEWAHATAPYANIMLVEAPTSSTTALLAGVTYAASHGANVVSMSWGSSEFSTETSYDSTFSHAGTTYVAAAGDTSSAEWPALSPYVVSVGGTTLNLYSNNNYASESAWSDGGGGLSKYEAAPSYQSKLGYHTRANPDVAYDADPNTGYYVYDSYSEGGWVQVGGTSAGAPQWAAIIALADQQRASAGKASLSTTQTLASIYAMSTSPTFGAATLTDVTTGSNGVYSAVSGYDLATGRGTPDAAKVISALASA